LKAFYSISVYLAERFWVLLAYEYPLAHRGKGQGGIRTHDQDKETSQPIGHEAPMIQKNFKNKYLEFIFD
jgi:hypothetical protein